MATSLEHRVQLGIILAACASPQLAKASASDGTERRICARLEVPRGLRRGTRAGTRYGEPFAFRQGAVRRQGFQTALARIEEGPPAVGDTVYVGACRSVGKLLTVGEAGDCSIEFSFGELSSVQKYTTMGVTKETVRLPGSARLRPIIPSLAPPPRSTASMAAKNGLELRVPMHAKSRCAKSPHVRDEMSRRVGVHLHERKQVLRQPI